MALEMISGSISKKVWDWANKHPWICSQTYLLLPIGIGPFYFFHNIYCSVVFVEKNVVETCQPLKTRFHEHFCKMKKPKKFDTFLYRHFNSNDHSPSKIVIQMVEKIIFDPNSSTRLKNIKRHETELNGLNFCNHIFL